MSEGFEEEPKSDVVAPVPDALNRNLRCCVPCHLVKTLEQFYESGCENCPFLQMDGDRGRIEESTTTDFQVRSEVYIFWFFVKAVIAPQQSLKMFLTNM